MTRDIVCQARKEKQEIYGLTACYDNTEDMVYIEETRDIASKIFKRAIKKNVKLRTS